MAVRANVLHVISATDCCHRVTTQLQVTNNNNNNNNKTVCVVLSSYFMSLQQSTELCVTDHRKWKMLITNLAKMQETHILHGICKI